MRLGIRRSAENLTIVEDYGLQIHACELLHGVKMR
jgi:hypothetical protein